MPKAQSAFKIPSILTTSFRVVVDLFGTNIYSIKGGGSPPPEKKGKQTLDSLYGFEKVYNNQYRVEYDYTQKHEDFQLKNPLDKNGMSRIENRVFSQMDKFKDPSTGKTHPPDLSVSEVVIEVDDVRLQDAIPGDPRSSKFDLTFSSDSIVSSVMREKTRQVNEDSFYKQIYNVHNLNLHRVVERESKYTDDETFVAISWGGPDDMNPKVKSNKIAEIVESNFIPGKFGTVKSYSFTKQDGLTLQSWT